MKQGIVKFFNESKGFRFVTEGDTVEFGLQEVKKGLNAVNVKVI
ncbi:MAG: cold shock CspA family protein [Urechidicola sp.]|jgi:cold shock CspA family protein|tara:strand:- start:197 stop:328 length:132 start_codon:yes stop_codon:yes gene_type:complete